MVLCIEKLSNFVQKKHKNLLVHGCNCDDFFARMEHMPIDMHVQKMKYNQADKTKKVSRYIR